jgi:sigma-B regulation protein RsbU (phosphoserine phosphatase)
MPATDVNSAQSAHSNSSRHTLMCSEVWASNRNVAHSVELPGLQGWIYSAPVELGHDGGDIHYFSSCDAGVISRVVLADVSGHGRGVAIAAERTLQLVRQHVNRLDQPTLLRELSSSLWRARTGGAISYATALVIGFDASADRLLVTNAGHPPPIWYRAAEERWARIEPPADMQVGLPIGLGLDGGYEDVGVTFEPGDLLVCYTDGLSDSTNSRGLSLGADGLFDLVRGMPMGSPMAVGATLLGLVDAFRRGAPAADDETLIVLQRPREPG